MFTRVDTEKWSRRHAYAFFKNFDDPFFNITATVDVTACYRRCREEHSSFFLNYLYWSLRAANEVEAFRLRLRHGDVVCYDTVHAGSTILMPDETFRFCYFDFRADLETFVREGLMLIDRERNNPGLDARDEAYDMIHYSVIPWISFSSFKHARRWGREDSIPKIVFGKFAEQGGKLLMPVSVEVHHALMDGIHVGRYFECFQQMLYEK